MSTSRCELLRWQFELTWDLFEVHLAELRTEDFLREPTGWCWTMRRGTEGEWVPDFAESEPDPVPVPTIAWLSWHIGWWWTVTADHARGRRPRDRFEIHWPGPGPVVVGWLRELRSEWLGVLDELIEADLDAIAPFPWNDSEHTVAHMVAWVNGELMKNAAEIGQLRMLYAADR